MTITTTPTTRNNEIKDYLGLVTGEVIVGANFLKNILAGIRDIVG